MKHRERRPNRLLRGWVQTASPDASSSFALGDEVKNLAVGRPARSEIGCSRIRYGDPFRLRRRIRRPVGRYLHHLTAVGIRFDQCNPSAVWRKRAWIQIVVGMRQILGGLSCGEVEDLD